MLVMAAARHGLAASSATRGNAWSSAALASSGSWPDLLELAVRGPCPNSWMPSAAAASGHVFDVQQDFLSFLGALSDEISRHRQGIPNSLFGVDIHLLLDQLDGVLVHGSQIDLHHCSPVHTSTLGRRFVRNGLS